MTRRPVELLVLDGQGVVFNDPLASFFDHLADTTGQARAAVHARWRDGVRDRAWRGTIEEREIWRALAGVDDRDWSASLEAAYAPGPAAPRLPAWASRAPVWLLTNHRTSWIEPRLDRFGLRPWFDRLLVSDALRALKPERSVFTAILAFVANPAAILVVDDQQKNVTAATALGMSAVLASPDGGWIFEVDRRLDTTH